MEVASASLTCRVAPDDESLLNCVRSAARVASRPVRPLHLQALLQLPRLADECGIVSSTMADSLLTELARELPFKDEWLVPDLLSSPRSSHFHDLDAEKARDVMQRFHYLHSPRTDGRSYGLSTDTGRLVAMCVSSPLDVELLRGVLTRQSRPTESARVVSRVFAFEGAPYNTISYMLSRAAQEEKKLGVTDFITYVNPNMGFTGSSYRASGWQLMGTEPGTKYKYLDGRYITDRQLTAEFGKHDDEDFHHRFGPRFAVSVMQLSPLLVFHTSFQKD
jgi:hypothetical protein